MSGIPELLYHAVLVVYDGQEGLEKPSRRVDVLGTFSTLPAAKAFAATGLQVLGYEPADFAEYAVQDGKTPWAYGDGVLVYAKAFAGQEFAVGIDTTPNDQEFAAGPNGTILLSAYPDASDPAQHLHYVLQTEVDYDQEPGSKFKTTEIEGCYLHRADAIDAAKASLKNSGIEFAQYEERKDLGTTEDVSSGESGGAAVNNELGPSLTFQWPFGEEVLVHAVSQTGENYEVSIRTIPGAHKKHAKKSQTA